jgi:tartrate-resistant acid phosphatase type 5
MNRRDALLTVGLSALSAVTPAAFAREPDSQLNFLVVGDWGRDGANHQREVALQMAKKARQLRCSHVFSVGDNFYDNGVQSAVDPQWRSSFEDVYSARSLQIPWYVALGNHDYRGDPQAQVEYTQVSRRWRMPARYYKIAGSEVRAPHLDLFVIDTSPLVNQYRDDVHGAIAKNVVSQDVDAQLRWLDQQLGASTADWKLVIGHHTLRSGGSAHGDTPEMVQLVEPLLRKHRVRAYINGHDHDLQHIRRDGMDYIGCGAGSEARPVQAVEGTLFCAARSGFAAMMSRPDSLSIEFHDLRGVRLYRAQVARRSQQAA